MIGTSTFIPFSDMPSSLKNESLLLFALPPRECIEHWDVPGVQRIQDPRRTWSSMCQVTKLLGALHNYIYIYTHILEIGNVPPKKTTTFLKHLCWFWTWPCTVFFPPLRSYIVPFLLRSIVPRLETLHEVLLGTANFQQQLLGGLAW